MKTQQLDMYGNTHATHTAKTIEDNWTGFFQKNPEFRDKPITDQLIWLYLQKFHGVTDGITMEQFFHPSFPKLDSLRRVYSKVQKQFNQPDYE